VEEAVVRARKELDEYGADCGAISIRWRLEDAGVTPLPARATVHRILVRRGQVWPQPRKRPRSSSSRRFAADRPNEMWQLDGFESTLADGQTATVIQVVDDCSRLDLACRAAASENAADVWAAVQDAIGRHGLPKTLLTDNGSALNGSRRGFSTDLEDRLRALGVTPIASSIGHPQTCGKDERAHQTALQWLGARPPAGDIGELQALLDEYRDSHNTRRRHQGIGGLTPQQRWDLADRAGPGGAPIPDPPIVTRPVVSPRGAVGVDGCEIALAKRFAGARTVVFRTGDHVVVFIGAHAVRALDLDRSRRYQPSGINPRTGQPKRR
jgi:transposase InsO family protein